MLQNFNQAASVGISSSSNNQYALIAKQIKERMIFTQQNLTIEVKNSYNSIFGYKDFLITCPFLVENPVLMTSPKASPFSDSCLPIFEPLQLIICVPS